MLYNIQCQTFYWIVYKRGWKLGFSKASNNVWWEGTRTRLPYAPYCCCFPLTLFIKNKIWEKRKRRKYDYLIILFTSTRKETISVQHIR